MLQLLGERERLPILLEAMTKVRLPLGEYFLACCDRFRPRRKVADFEKEGIAGVLDRQYSG